jgi:glycosyltransferase involved in cell wall biosynthesis
MKMNSRSFGEKRDTGKFEMIEKLRILSPDRMLPERFGGYIRTYNIAKLLRDLFREIEILAVDEEYFFDGEIDGIRFIQEEKYHHDYERLIQYYHAFFSRNFAPKVPAKTFSNKTDYLFQLESPYFYNLIKKEKIKNFVLNEFDVNWEMSNLPHHDLKLKIYKKLFSEREREVEIEALKRSSLILTCSEIDKEKILKEIPDVTSKIMVMPNCVDFKEFSSYLDSNNKVELGGKKFTVTFIGSLFYPPNQDAVNIIVSNIAPHFTNDVQFLIVGKNPPNIKTPSNVHFLGYVENIKETIHQSDICIAPLRFGGGTRIKILEYMAMKKPVISTTKGAEGLDARHGEHIILEDNLNLFHDQITSLLNDEKKMRIIGENGQKLVKEKYDWILYKDALENEYKRLL